MMLRLSVVITAVLFACTSVGSKETCIPAGSSIAITRSSGAGDCPAGVVAGVTSLNPEPFTPAKDLSCGVVHFNLNLTFIQQDGNHQMCNGVDSSMFEDLGSAGGTGTSSMTVTCADNSTCMETFDITFVKQ